MFASEPATTTRQAKRGKARRLIDRPPSFQGWRTTDAEEIERRRWRGRVEVVAVEALEPDRDFFGSFRVGSASGNRYTVEIRSLGGLENSCDCLDHRVNGLGTCKHIEGTLGALRRGRARAFAKAARHGSPRVEVYLGRYGDPAVRVGWPVGNGAAAPARPVLAPFLSNGEALSDDSMATLEALRQAIAAAPAKVRDLIRLSRHLDAWIDEQRRRDARDDDRKRFLAGLAHDRNELDLLRHPLLPYQRDGVLHLAFGERALLADEMGLGKTVQAIGACELLRRRRGIRRVLVVCPASLKAEWEDQIARFTDLPACVIRGTRADRRRDYRRSAFFYLANYEQVIPDRTDINETLSPDVVILDEAQRIKNWQTKTARAVKALRSPYAFILTGTPLENRIDDIYSIIQYLDPGLLGPLFKFNREFYRLDERGRPVDYQNLETLHRRLQPVLLRRRKADVEDQLPARTVRNYFVAMEDEQRLRYQEYEARVARLLALAHRRGLTKEEFDRLQKGLACMRMLCDTPYILDPDCRVSPKLEELEGILSDLLAEPDRKVIVFSEWVRMLEMVRDLAHELGLDFAWHTGSVPQDRRRAEIKRFKKDPGCRLFLSTDSGSVGLNLQAASVVINLDLPWNPAKLEQRIARAWRKHQTRPVSVVNLVCQDSIEHRMLHLLSQKKDLADGVLDGVGDLAAIRMPSGRAAFLQRLEAMMAAAPGAAPPVPGPDDLGERLRQDLLARHGKDLLLLETHRDDGGRQTVLAVLDADRDAAGHECAYLTRQFGDTGGGAEAPAPRFEVLDGASFAAVRRLVDAGVLKFAAGAPHELHRAPGLDAAAPERLRRRLARAGTLFTEAERQLRMATLLSGGGFAAEARAPLSQAVTHAVRSAAALADDRSEPEDGRSLAQWAGALAASGHLPEDSAATVALFDASGNGAEPAPADRVPALIDAAQRLLAVVETSIHAGRANHA